MTTNVFSDGCFRRRQCPFLAIFLLAPNNKKMFSKKILGWGGGGRKHTPISYHKHQTNQPNTNSFALFQREKNRSNNKSENKNIKISARNAIPHFHWQKKKKKKNLH